MQNVEFKCELRDPALARLIAAQIGARRVGVLKQIDTYFKVPDGRLKRRECEGEPTEYIFYHRLNRSRPKLSHFTIYSEEEARARFGTRDLPVWVVVNKSRDLWMYAGVRLHLDQVEGLGNFFEAEALVTPAQHVGKCHEAIAEVRKHFGPALGELIATSYCDLLAGEMEIGQSGVSPGAGAPPVG
jgi:adenylate cyclase class IV